VGKPGIADMKFRFWVLSVCALGGLAALVWIATNHDENYGLQKLIFGERYRRYDGLIVAAATRYGVDPSLVKAVMWKESRFQPEMLGTRGERGLMQITERAALDWARAEKVETFVPTDLLDPKTNIEAGAWYLATALRHWSGKDDPIPFALAEYNAGRTRVKRWERDSGLGGGFGAEDLRATMDFPATKDYIRSIVDRYRDFKKQEEFPRQSTQAGR
jgi:soluble lytic murein transglycosylase